MSVKHLVYVWDRSPQHGAALLVLMALADYADEDGMAQVSVKALAERARVSERHVTSLLKELVASGDVDLVKDGGGQERAVYNLMYRDTDTKRPVKIARPAPTTGPVREVFEYWVSRMGKNKRTILDNKRRDAVKRALKALSLDECKLAIEGCHATPHNMGVNPTGVCYNDLTLIFRDASHWERFIETAAKAGRRPVTAKDAEPEPEVPRLSPEEQQAINLAGIRKLAQAIGRPGSR